MSQFTSKSILITLLLAAIAAFFVFDLSQYASLSAIKAQQERFAELYLSNRLLILASFFVAYVAITSLSIPLATPMTLIGGAVFGFWTGLVLISFASTIGATLAFLIARFLMQETVKARFGAHMTKLYDGFEKEGAFYLFALRLVPVFPFFLVNAVTALMPVRLWTFYWVSQLGMFPGTVIYVYAGTQLAQLETLGDITSPGMLAALAGLGLAPIVLRKLVEWIRKGQGHAKV